jgi:osmotically-inducible protein OsmY
MNGKSLLMALTVALGFAALPLAAATSANYGLVKTAAAQDDDTYNYERRYDDRRHEDWGDQRHGYMSDWAIRDSVSRALSNQMGADANAINVHVNDGVVHLSGDVSRPRERWQARRVADSVRGVRTVDIDRLAVRRY